MRFTVQDIYSIFTTVFPRNKDYYLKYKKVPFNLEDNIWKWQGHDYARIPCLLDFREWLVKHNINGDQIKLLYTSNDDPEVLYLKPKEKILLEYDINTQNNDLHILDYYIKDFNFAIISQTLEHLYDPKLCLQNIAKHLVSGGYLFVSVPTITLHHMTPIHFYSYTTMGLALLAIQAGFEIVELGQWGNKKYIDFMFEYNWWPDVHNLIDRFGNIENEPQNAAQCWALLKKP